MKNNSYFIRSFLILAFGGLIFLFFRQFLPERLFPESNSKSEKILTDSLMLQAISEAEKDTIAADTLSNNENYIVFEPVNGIRFPAELKKDFRGYGYLIPFYEALYQLEKNPENKVRIAYFGDSMIDGDFITQDLREYFQTQFGGQGIGFVPITSESAKSRASIVHRFSGNWRNQSLVNTSKPSKSFGVSGSVFFDEDTLNASWVKYQATSYKKYIDQLFQPKLFYGKSTNSNAKVNNSQLNPDKLLNTLNLQPKANTLNLQFTNAQNIPFYGLSFDDGKGIHIDNFSSRGNSGLPISLLDVDLINAFDKELNYNLIVLHFGANVLSSGKTKYDWYGKAMIKIVQHVKKCFPNAAVLIISTADKASKIKGEMQTDPAVEHLLKAQRNYAIQAESGFINLFKLMGGEGSMTKWVEEKPVLANKDYTHFNAKGSEKVAGLIYNQISEGYRIYKKLQSDE